MFLEYEEGVAEYKGTLRAVQGLRSRVRASATRRLQYAPLREPRTKAARGDTTQPTHSKMTRPIASRTSTRLALALATAGLTVMATVATGQTPAAPQAAPATAPAPAAAAPAAPAATAGDPARGKLKSATCVGCHAVPGFKSAFPSVYSVPLLGGQNAKYIESALQAYKKGERRFPSMIATARSLSDQDMADLAAYFAAQH